MRPVKWLLTMSVTGILLIAVLTACSGSAESSSRKTDHKKTEKPAETKTGPEEETIPGKAETSEKPEEQEKKAVTETSEIPEIWPETDAEPVHLMYGRLWGYGQYADTDDAEMIAEAVGCLKALRIGDRTDMCVDDYTDILTFTFPDGSTRTLVFEENIWVADEGVRYEVSGLKPLRRTLDPLMDEDS